MATQTLLVLALLAGLACSSPASRIAGGEPTTVEEFPSIVQVEFGGASGLWTQSCGGFVLTARYILTAAHCFHGVFYEPRFRRIRAGTSQRNTGGVVSYVDVEINHPTYGVNDNDGDISIVRLLESLVYSNVIQQGTIVAQGVLLPAGLPITVAGWGATQLGGMNSDELRETTVYTIDNELCAERYAELPLPREVTDNMICASILDVGGKGACQGDFGGPLLYNNLLVGIISFTDGCGDGDIPTVATAVSSYTDWIVATAV